MTKTLNKHKTKMSLNIKDEIEKDTKKRIKKVIISNKRSVINNHSEAIKKTIHKDNQINNINLI